MPVTPERVAADGNCPHPTLTTRVLAFDFGTRHIGIAVGQTITGSASGIATLRARDGHPDWKDVRALVVEWQPDLLIVGLPLNMDGTESDMSERVRAFAARLGEHTALAVELVDERLTSFEAKGLDPDDNHAVAAKLIAETWLAGSG